MPLLLGIGLLTVCVGLVCEGIYAATGWDWPMYVVSAIVLGSVLGMGMMGVICVVMALQGG